MSRTADVVIIGGGVTGMSLAFHRTDTDRDPFRLDRFAAGVSAGSFVNSYLTPSQPLTI